MPDMETDLEDSETEDLADLMGDVANQLSDDLYDITPADRHIDEELENIGDKLAQDVDDIDLEDANLHGDDEAINLLDDFKPTPPADSGLSYEDPNNSSSDFASALQSAQNDRQASESPSGKMSAQEDDSFLDDDDPMLLLDEELIMDKESNEGGILTIAALVLAVVGIAIAGFSTWQNINSSSQITELTNRLDNPPPPEPDPKLIEIESMLSQTDKKLSTIDTRLHSDAASLKDLDDRLRLILEEQQKFAAQTGKLEGIETQLKGLGDKIGSIDGRISENQKQLEAQQQEMRTEFTAQLQTLSTTPPPAKVTAATDPAAVAVQTLQPAKKDTTTSTSKPASTAKTGSSGPWVANLASFRAERDALRLLKSLQRHGIFPKKRKIYAKGKSWYRLYVDGFANMRAANRYIEKVKGKPGLNQAWAGRAN
jgi:cell division protein FtsN